MKMKAVRLEKNTGGDWTAFIFSVSFSGSYQECVRWLLANGEREP